MKQLLLAAVLLTTVSSTQAITHDDLVEYCTMSANFAYSVQRDRVGGTSINTLNRMITRYDASDEVIDMALVTVKSIEQIDPSGNMLPRSMQVAQYDKCMGILEDSY